MEPDAKADPKSEVKAKVWAHYLRVFGDKLRIKDLTPARERTITKALSAAGDDENVLIAAIDGLKSYRQAHPDGSQDTTLSVIFETGPHSRSNLADQIEWWAGQAEGRVIDDVMANVPQAIRGQVMDLRGQVREGYRTDKLDDPRVQQALAWLRARVHMEPDHWDGRKLTWKKVAGEG